LNDLKITPGTTQFIEGTFTDLGCKSPTYVSVVVWPNGDGVDLFVSSPQDTEERRLALSWQEAEVVTQVLKMSIQGTE
jgi:hypothetical protein